MFNSVLPVRTGRAQVTISSGGGRLLRVPILLIVMASAMLTGCESRQEKALDQAKQQAAKTGQAQQVVSVDKNGTTTTTVVTPPQQGKRPRQSLQRRRRRRPERRCPLRLDQRFLPSLRRLRHRCLRT
jgi:hypothetical protein